MATAAVVLAKSVVQGTTWTASAPLPFARQTVTGTLALDPERQADPTFCIQLTIEAFSLKGGYEPVSYKEWRGGPLAGAPTITWDGLARRVRLCIDQSRPASVGATISNQ